MSKHQHRETFRSLCALSALASLFACDSQFVDLGENSNELSAPDSICENGAFAGSVLVEDQEQLNGLTGCERIDGDLSIRPFAGADLTPLAALRVVGGTLDVGHLSAFDVVELEIDPATIELEFTLLDAGWLPSIEGLASLEQAGSLILRGLSAPSIEPLSRLRALTDAGTLQISSCRNLRTLAGLDNVTGLVDISLDCLDLESLDGLSFPRAMRDLTVSAPALVDIGAFDVETMNTLTINNTSLQRVDALSSLTRASAVILQQNPLLENLDGLAGLEYLEELSVLQAGRLEHLPVFSSLGQLKRLRLIGNPILADSPSSSLPGLAMFFDSLGGTIDQIGPEEFYMYRAEQIEIWQNPALVHLDIPRGWQGAGIVDIVENQALETIDFGDLHTVEFTTIVNNPVLDHVDLGALRTVNELSVVNNARLPLSEFDGVSTFERTLSVGPIDFSEP